MNLPRVSDLLALSKAVAGRPGYNRLATLIRKALTAQSCASDLRQAAAIIEAGQQLRRSPRGRGTPTRDATEAAQLMAAVSLYTRATWSSLKSGDRGAINIAEALTFEQKKKHKAIIDIRNKALAHVHPSMSVAGSIWHESLLIAVESEAGWKIGGASRQTWQHGPLWDALVEMVPAAEAIINIRVVKHINAISALMNDNKLAVAELEKHLVDPVALFGSEEAAAAMMPGAVGTTYVQGNVKAPLAP